MLMLLTLSCFSMKSKGCEKPMESDLQHWCALLHISSILACSMSMAKLVLASWPTVFVWPWNERLLWCFCQKTVFRNKVRHSNISRPCFCLMCRQRSREIACACRIPYRLAYTQPITSDYIPEFSLLSYCCLQPKRAFTQKLIWHLTMWMS